MTMLYIPFDTALCGRVSLGFARAGAVVETKTGPWGFQLARHGTDYDYVQFQFPPKITTDSRRGNWEEKDQRGDEPVAAYKTSGAREITLAWTYIVDGSKQWSTQAVAKQVRLVRGYFARTRASKGDYRNLVATLRMWYLGGSPVGNGPDEKTKEMTCRIKGVDVKHSETIVAPNGDPSQAYHLRTDITADLRIWTKGGAEEAVQNLKILADKEFPQWY